MHWLRISSYTLPVNIPAFHWLLSVFQSISDLRNFSWACRIEKTSSWSTCHDCVQAASSAGASKGTRTWTTSNYLAVSCLPPVSFFPLVTLFAIPFFPRCCFIHVMQFVLVYMFISKWWVSLIHLFCLFSDNIIFQKFPAWRIFLPVSIFARFSELCQNYPQFVQLASVRKLCSRHTISRYTFQYERAESES